MSSNSNQLYKLPHLFFAVRMANVFLENAGSIEPVSEDDEKYINYMRGEAHAQLAYQYFKGFRIWGSLPWINKVLEGGE